MAKKYDVIALGELLIDFTMNGQSERSEEPRLNSSHQPQSRMPSSA